VSDPRQVWSGTRGAENAVGLGAGPALCAIPRVFPHDRRWCEGYVARGAGSVLGAIPRVIPRERGAWRELCAGRRGSATHAGRCEHRFVSALDAAAALRASTGRKSTGAFELDGSPDRDLAGEGSRPPRRSGRDRLVASVRPGGSPAGRAVGRCTPGGRWVAVDRGEPAGEARKA
jgi:hypothetical protein